MQDKLNATKADQPTSWEHIKGAGGVFFAALCDNYPAQLPVYRSGMESIIESLLFYFEYDGEMVDTYISALKEAASVDRLKALPF